MSETLILHDLLGKYVLSPSGFAFIQKCVICLKCPMQNFVFKIYTIKVVYLNYCKHRVQTLSACIDPCKANIGKYFPFFFNVTEISSIF